MTNNVHLFFFFKLSRGIRQGCPISALLFILVAEVSVVFICESKEIHGIYVNERVIKHSIKAASDIFENFYKYSGLKINKSKMVAFIVENKCVNLENNEWGIKWTTKPFKTLGIWFANDLTEMISLNTSAKIDTISSIINSWLQRKLTLKGKLTTVKSLILPQILQLASVLPLSKSCIMTLDQNICNFVWNNNKHLVSKALMLLPIELGGLKMISTKYVCSTAHNMFIKKWCNDIKAK